jgi:GNAT superfamily N-acetyltransferase
VPMNITLRKANLEDLGIIHAIRRDAILGIQAEFSQSALLAWADKRSPEFFADRVAANHVTIASSEGKGIAWGSSSEEWITGLYVCSSWSGRGVGRTLMSRLETEILQRENAYAKLGSSPNAIDFYTILGYVPFGLLDGDGALPMKKRLKTAPEPRFV